MVLDEGRLCEFDTPERLLADPDSLFGALVRNAAAAGEGGGDVQIAANQGPA